MDQHTYLLQVSSVPNLTWPQRVSAVSKAYNVNASVAAQMLDPYYKSVEDMKWVLAYLANPIVVTFINQVADMVKLDQLKWSESVGHVARQLNIPADKAAVLLSNSMKSRY